MVERISSLLPRQSRSSAFFTSLGDRSSQWSSAATDLAPASTSKKASTITGRPRWRQRKRQASRFNQIRRNASHVLSKLDWINQSSLPSPLRDLHSRRRHYHWSLFLPMPWNVLNDDHLFASEALGNVISRTRPNALVRTSFLNSTG